MPGNSGIKNCMAGQIHIWLNKSYPQNFIVRKPFIGTLIFVAFCYCFLIIYKPLNIHESQSLSLELTMALYCSTMIIPVYGIIFLLKQIPFFSDSGKWTITKELISVLLILTGVGITIYFAGFLIEVPANRWNLSTLANSFVSTLILGVLPFLFFTLINYRYLFVSDISRIYDPAPGKTDADGSEELIRIRSQLKKEELSISPGQFMYAESDGNYVVFYLNIEGKIKKKIIRNSISNIDKQLSIVPFFMRIHRAFIVNVKQVVSQKGNTLGYRIKLNQIDDSLPVSRQKTKEFDQLLKRYR